MAIGKMNKRVLLQYRQDVTDAGGGRAITWVDKETVWAEVKPLRGEDQIHAMGLRYPITHRITIRYRSDVTPEWRIQYDSRSFNIHAKVDPDEDKRFLILSCEEGVVT